MALVETTASAGGLRVLCAGIVVLDEVFRVDHFPAPNTKADATDYMTVGGGCAANAAVAIARLGGRVSFAGPLGGPAAEDDIGDRILANLAREDIDCTGCVRVIGAPSPVSGIFVNAQGERTIVTHRDPRLSSVRPADAVRLVSSVHGVLVDNRCPEFVAPICEAARANGIPLVLDADKPTRPNDPLLAMATHIIFSEESLAKTTGIRDMAAAVVRIGEITQGFVAVTNGPGEVLWSEGGGLWRMPAFKIEAIDTLGAGDVFHGAFTLALLDGHDVFATMRFASAAAAVKCTRFGGGATSPSLAEVQAFLKQRR